MANVSLRAIGKNILDYNYPLEVSGLSHLSQNDAFKFGCFGTGKFIMPDHQLIHIAIKKWVQTNPDIVAVCHKDDQLTYRQLDLQAQKLAAQLSALGIVPGDTVCLFLERSFPMVIGIVAVLMLGACYVPQDAKVVPEVQLNHIAKAVKAKVILTIAKLADSMPRLDGVSCIAIDEFLAHSEDATKKTKTSQLNPIPEQLSVSPDDTCLILFTSGTTGDPNGVQITHRNLCNIILTEPGSLGIKPGDKVAQILSISFDLAAWEILGCLSHGGTLLVREGIEETVAKADVVIATPSILATCDAKKCRGVKTVALAGEPCPRSLADEWAEFCNFYNCCGPTETTIVNTMKLHSPKEEHLTIGSPTPNNTVYILDEELNPCPLGEVGEMWAGGDCVTTGYLDNPELTGERYRPDPFLGGMMFRTRDLGRWLENGELEHLGRTDDQVKVRGFRVELNAVSQIIEKTPGCRCAITIQLDNRRLASFVRPIGVDITAIRQQVAVNLAYYCMPEIIIPCNYFPLTSRGKIDKRALRQIALAQLASNQSE